MSTDTHHGLYCENYGWEFYFNRSNSYIGLRTSSTPYPVTMSGDSYTNGWSRSANGFYVEETGVHFTHQGTSGEIDMTSNNEFLWGSSSANLYFNYRAVSRGTTVTHYIWHAGSSSSYATHTLGALTANGNQTLYGLTSTCNSGNSASYTNAAMQIREYNFGGSQTDTWGNAPRLAWHWSGRVQAQIGLSSDNHLYISEDGSFSSPKLIIHAGNIGSQSVSYATSAGSANYVSYTSRQGKGSGVAQFAQYSGSTDNPTNDWYSHIIMNHANSAGYYTEIATCFHSDSVYFRRQTSGTTSAWKKFAWTSDIPSVGNGTITITQNGVNKGSFTMNQSGDTTIALTDTDTNTNYYPTAFSWTGGTTAGPTGSLTGTGMSAVSFAAIPSASNTSSGIVTTAVQEFAGQKTFRDGIRIGSSASDHSTNKTKIYFGDGSYVWIGEASEDDAFTIFGQDYVYINTKLNAYTTISSSNYTTYPGVVCDSMYLKSAAYHIGTVTKLQPETASTTVTQGHGIPGVTISQSNPRGGKRTITITNSSGFRIYVHSPHVAALFLDKGGGSCYEHGFAYIQTGTSFPYTLSNGSSLSFYVIFGYLHT